MKFSHAASSRLPRAAALSGAALAVAATAGIMFSQVDGPQPAQAAANTVAANLVSPSASQSPAGHVHPAIPVSPAAPTQAPTPPATPSKVLNYTFQLQPNYYYCGPAATRIALSASGHTLSQDQVANLLGTTTGGTNSANDTTRGLNSVLGRNVYQTREIPAYPATPAQMDQLQADVVSSINGGRVIVANIAGHLTDTAGAFHSYEGGHFLTIVGYSDGGRTVKIADPANPTGDGTYSVTTINMANWIGGHGYSY